MHFNGGVKLLGFVQEWRKQEETHRHSRFMQATPYMGSAVCILTTGLESATGLSMQWFSALDEHRGAPCWSPAHLAQRGSGGAVFADSQRKFGKRITHQVPPPPEVENGQPEQGLLVGQGWGKGNVSIGVWQKLRSQQGLFAGYQERDKCNVHRCLVPSERSR